MGDPKCQPHISLRSDRTNLTRGNREMILLPEGMTNKHTDNIAVEKYDRYSQT